MSENFVPVFSVNPGNNGNEAERVEYEEPFFEKLEEEEKAAAEKAAQDGVSEADATGEYEPEADTFDDFSDDRDEDDGEKTDETDSNTTEIKDDGGESDVDVSEVKDEGMSEFVQSINTKLDEMMVLFNKRIARTDAEEKVIDNMHRELQVYKDDLYINLIRPILVDVANMRNSIIQISDIYAKKSEDATVPLDVFETYKDDLKEILEKNTVNVYASEVGELFNPRRQKLVKRVYTPVKELDKTVASIVGEGYEYNGSVIVYENVEVYWYKEEAKENE